ncbi:SSL2 DNA or RNA helicases of superfamily II [uncultured Caudovirales phage]|uniref:SSL2 DNA or RNA helicases of superfamily II n=1 Tax=uncultured Caudovirales phage TaxID=2100421 RepID=A0A6J5NR01_9CAUD|nr:SSL2 DNA or RNA helicases of superfamily II [uncultured Caudovirales phage]
MLRFKLTPDKKFIKLIDTTLNLEKTNLVKFFKRKSKKAAFNVLVDRGIWDGFDSFITKNNEIAVGLWKEIHNFCEKYEYDFEIEGDELFINKNLDKSRYFKYVEELLDGIVDEKGDPIVPRDYQIEGAYRAIKYRFCTQELATSAGKTLIFFIYNSFLRDGGKINKDKKSLIIVPNISLVGQTVEKFVMYAQPGKEWNVCPIGGKDKFSQEKFDKADIVISTYQSLQNLPFEFFQKFSVVQVDEVHKSKGDTIRDILLACKNWEYRLGLSGTVKLEEQYSDFFRVQESVGPLVMVLSAKHLIDHGYSPNIEIKILELAYDEKDERIQKYFHLKEHGKSMYNSAKDFGRDMLSIEKGILFESKERLDFINDLVKKFEKNSLILFSDVKNGYGKLIQSKILEWNPNTFYIDGEVDSSDRDKFKEILESQDGVVIVASFGTFATGIDSKNLHHIILAESTKAEITLRQAIGRGMRKLAEKSKVIVWDLVDQLDGYSVRHSKIREEIYKEQKFEVSKSKVDLTKKRP